ncbi:DUF1588 domain-containing protein [Lentisphaera profundi]|uniref:DUF1588 domain-containing protein n=1 Tax=Lentisphaera profundi TaxID=1658616 RepID=A0ABY7VSD0_9BACT|nr:DUF1588 domain-containing protein [Lentisphaera profundi]WDE97116.1 DUF1588 domain-containing protein [Lentisphaera profundi]
MKLLMTSLLFITGMNLMSNEKIDYNNQIKPFLEKHCIECHGGEKIKAKLDFTKINSPKDIKLHFEMWEEALELIHEGEMPPEERDQPELEEKKIFTQWYKHNFEEVEAHPGFSQPRRLSTMEYKNSLEDIFGFNLEVQVQEAHESKIEKSLVKKLFPVDPPGRSGFQNDTYGSQFASSDLSRYAFIADKTIEKLFNESEKLSAVKPPNKITKKQTAQILSYYLSKIYRRSLNKEEIASLKVLIGKNTDLWSMLRMELKAALISPKFLYRGLDIKGTAGEVFSVSNDELAQRLSYFLWGSVPDEKLLKLAKNKSLKDEEVWEMQIKRMVEDQRSQRFIEDIAVQWFALNEMDHLGGRLPYDDALKNQPIKFFEYLIKEDRPLIELIDSKVTYANGLIEKFYKKDSKQITRVGKEKGIEMVIQPLQKIELKNTENRGGILTMPGILAMNGVKGRTSPVLRGTWVLERILGDHLPEPPMDVGAVPNNKKGEILTFRQRFEAHRSNKTCAVCHDRIDPLGFALESYDDSGGFRTHEMIGKKKNAKKGAAIDASGQMPSGEKFKSFLELKSTLVNNHSETITRNIVKRFMSYALCRKLELYDQPEVERITKQLNENQGTYLELIKLVTTSLPFTKTVIAEEI